MTNLSITTTRSKAIASICLSPSRARPLMLVLGGCLWCACITVGFAALLIYKHQEGSPATPPEKWPSNAQLSYSSQRQTLLVFSHPHCPCTRATFRELERILTQAPNQVDVHVVFAAIEGVATQSKRSALAPAAERLGSDAIHHDRSDLCRQFRVKTSGHVLLYDANGTLRFSGGITASRGHEGRTNGGDALVELLLRRTAARSSFVVFGCPLFDTACDNELAACLPPKAGT
jgi:hypothetical protein